MKMNYKVPDLQVLAWEEWSNICLSSTMGTEDIQVDESYTPHWENV